jgi:CHAT domain-containing protein/tetratricopeptide (TPR) repeat protein
MVRAITLAHDDGTDAAERARWQDRLGNDPASRALLDATLARLAFRYDDAERLYRAAAADSLGHAGAWGTLGLAAVAGSRGSYVTAMQTFARAAEQMQRLGDAGGLTEARLGQSLTTLRVLGVDSATVHLRAAREALPAADGALRARVECVALQLRVRAGAPVPDTTWQRVRRDAAPYGPRLRAECGFVHAQYVESLGKATDALALLDTVATDQRRARLWNALSATRQWQGSTLLARGNYGRAREALTEALDLAARSASVNGEAWATQELGRIAQRLGATGDATRLFAEARARFAASDDRVGVAFADRALADGALLRGSLAAADSIYLATLQQLDALAPPGRVQVLVARADIARRTRDVAESAVLLDSAEALSLARNLPGWGAEIRYQRGLVALANGQPARAIAQWDTLLRRHNPQGQRRFEVFSRWAEAEAAGGRLDAAWTTFGMAARTLDGWSSGFRRREDRLAALQDRAFDWDRDLSTATLVSRFATAGRAPEALAMAEWRRVRGKEQAALQRGALAIDASGAVGVVVRATDTAALDPRRFLALARARLAPAHAVVSYVVGQGGEPTTAFVLTRDTLVSVTLAPIDSLAPRIERFTAFLQAGRVMAPLAEQLSAAVLAPVLAMLPPSVRRLVLVPDGELHRLPFAALMHPAGDVLAAHVELALAPSMDDALGSALAVARPGRSAGVPRPLIVGAPERLPVDATTGRPWAALPGARREARAIQSLLHGAALLDGRAVTHAALVHALSISGPVLHVATHAVADPTSFERNGLVVQPTADDDGLFDLSALAAQPLPFDLVVLSACSSGDGVLLTGQALHGLVSTALDAGARGVVATRWRVDDAAIVPYMVRLHERLLAGDDVVGALHTVRTEARRVGASPAIWANLEFVGDPTLQVTLTARRPSMWARLGGAMRGWLRALGGSDEP